MVISYHGRTMMKVSQGDFVLAFNPISKDSSAKAARFGADIVFVSMDHTDTNGVENASYGDRSPFVVDGPGEYEVSGVYIKGIPTIVGDTEGARTNTVYTVRLEDISICHLGLVRSKDEITASVREQIGATDVVFVPVGGEGVLLPEDAHKIATMLEPSYIIPLYDGDDVALKRFLKEEGVTNGEPADKLTIKKKDVAASEGVIAVLRGQ